MNALTGKRRGGRPWHGGIALALAMAVLATGCDDFLDVENPNKVVQDDLDNPAAAAAIVNGALSTVARGHGVILLVPSTAADELKWVGSRDAWRQLAYGDLSDPRNEFTDAAYPWVNEGRWMADEAIRRLRLFDGEGTLADKTLLARALLYSAISYTFIADFFEDFVIASDGKEAAPPLGEANMVQLYDQAVQKLDEALSIAQAAGNSALETTILAQRARTKHAKGVWGKVNPAGTIAADPLVNDAGANQDAQAFLARQSDLGWTFQFAYSANTVANDVGAWMNERLEMRVGDPYIVPDATDKQVGSIRLQDPIDGVPDPVLASLVNTAVTNRQFGPNIVVSAREMHLILAEAALAAGDDAGFTQHINHVRTGLAAYSGQIPALDMLKHARRVNLFLQGRRLADHYRFNDPSVEWLASSEARQRPGTFLPITEVERLANCHILGTC